MKWITKMVMEMVLFLTVVLMETPKGGRRSPPEVIPGRFPPPIFSDDSLLSPVSWFCVSLLPPHETPWGTIFIVGFRSRRSQGTKIDVIGATRAQMTSPTRPRNLAAWAYVFWPPLFGLLRSYAFFLPKTDPRKFSGHLDVVWVPETSKYRK